MKTRPIQSGVFALALFGFAMLAGAAEPQSKPPIQIEQAIEKAKDHIRIQIIDVTKHHITSAKFVANVEATKGPFWLLTWELDANYNPVVKTLGGQVFVKVYLDHPIEVTYGE